MPPSSDHPWWVRGVVWVSGSWPSAWSVAASGAHSAGTNSDPICDRLRRRLRQWQTMQQQTTCCFNSNNKSKNNKQEQQQVQNTCKNLVRILWPPLCVKAFRCVLSLFLCVSPTHTAVRSPHSLVLWPTRLQLFFVSFSFYFFSFLFCASVLLPQLLSRSMLFQYFTLHTHTHAHTLTAPKCKCCLL